MPVGAKVTAHFPDGSLDAPSVEDLAAHLIAHDATPPRGTDLQASAEDLLAAFSDDDAFAVAKRLYSVTLGRLPEDDSAAEILRAGADPVRLAYGFLMSQESRDRPVRHRAELIEVVVQRLVRRSWGLTDDELAIDAFADADAAFIIAAHRVGQGSPPSPEQFVRAKERIAGGRGREEVLRIIWQETGQVPRLFGVMRPGLRARAGRVRRPRRLAIFRAHVLAAEPATAAVLRWLTQPPQSLPQDLPADVTDPPLDLLRARVSELASGVRHLAGHGGW